MIFRIRRIGAPCLLLMTVGALAPHGFLRAADEIATIPATAVPVIDLTRLESEVAKQFESIQELLREVTGRRDATATQRAEAYGEFGRLLHAYGYFSEAMDCYRQATVFQPEDPRWWHLLGCAADSAGQPANAETAFRKAMQSGGTEATKLRLGLMLSQLNQRDQARRIFAELIEDDPKLAAAHAGAGAVALEGRDYPAAIKHFSRALELAPAATRLHYSLAMAYRGKGDLEMARQHLRLRGDIGLRPIDPLVDELPALLRGSQVHLMRGKVALAAGAISDAIREYRLAVQASPENAMAHVNLAAALASARQQEEAIQELEVALKLDPKNSAALFNLASLDLSQKKYLKAVDRLKQLLQLQPEDVAARRLLAQSLIGMNEPVQALEVLRDVRSRVPDDEGTALQLADALMSLNRFEEVQTLLNDEMARRPTRGLTAHALARFLASCPEIRLRDGNRAVQLAKSVYDASPSFEHTETLALALAAADRFEEAIRLQKQLLKAAEQQGIKAVATRVGENLKRYENGQAAP